MTVTSAAYPMVEEQQATGRVAAVYADMLAQMPMVPSLFKSLALCPPYLVMAWRQAGPVLQDGQAGAAGSKLASRVHDVTPPPSDAAIRKELGQFVGPLGRMLIIASGLRLALDGEIVAAPAQADITPAATAPKPERDVPPLGAVGDTRPFDAIRSQLSTPSSTACGVTSLLSLCSPRRGTIWSPIPRRPSTLVDPSVHTLGPWAHRSNGP